MNPNMNNNMNCNMMNNINYNMNNNMSMNHNNINNNFNNINNNYPNKNNNMINMKMNMTDFNNNMNNNMNNNIDKLNAQYKRYKELLECAKNHLNDENNVNHYLYEEYKKEENNSGPQRFKTNFMQKTNIEGMNLFTEVKYSNYEIQRVDVEKITDQEKNTTIKILGTKLPEKGGDFIIDVLEKFKMGYEEGQTMYDTVYIPIFKPEKINKYFVINFRKSSYIKSFNDAMINYLSKNEPNNKYEIYWYEKQGDKFKKYLKDKLEKKKNYKGFIKYL